MNSFLNDKTTVLADQLKRSNVLVIDDYQGMRTMLRNIIREAGAVNVETASNAAEAITKLKALRYDIVICDYNLGDGANGQQLLEDARMQKLVGTATIWMMVTAETTNDMVVGAAEIKPDDYLVKPINLDIMESRLLRQFAKKKDLRAIDVSIKSGNTEEAIRKCDELLAEKGGHHPDAMRIKGDLLIKSGRFDEAEELFRSAMSSRKLPWAMTGIGKVYFHSKRYEEAEEILRETITQFRIFMEAHDWLVKTLDEMGRQEDVIRALEDAVAVSPKSGSRQSDLGVAAYYAGDLSKAKAALQRSATLGKFSPSKSPKTLTTLAKTLSDMGDDREALNTLNLCKREFKASPELTVQVASVESIVFERAGDYESARKSLKAAMDAHAAAEGAMDAAAVFDLASAMLQAGEDAAAKDLIKRAVKSDHQSAKIAAMAQAVFDKAGLGDEGRDLIKSSTEDVIKINNEGVNLGKAGKFDEAIETLKVALDEIPANETILSNLAGMLLAKMRRDGRDQAMVIEARDILSRLRKVNPASKKLFEYAGLLAAKSA